jgi:hypothetical protein
VAIGMPPTTGEILVQHLVPAFCSAYPEVFVRVEQGYVNDLFDMLMLGAIWGGAFPLLRIASPAFGPVALIGVRCAAASIVLLALLCRREVLLARGRLFTLAMLNTAVPFTLFSYATLSINAGPPVLTRPRRCSARWSRSCGSASGCRRAWGHPARLRGRRFHRLGRVGLHGSGSAGFGADCWARSWPVRQLRSAQARRRGAARHRRRLRH